MADKEDLPQTPVTANGDTSAPRGSAKEAPASAAPVRSAHLADNSSALAKAVKTTRKKADGGVILVPVDFSAHSEAALAFAAKLADCLPAKLVVLHVVHDPGEMPGYYSKLVKKKRVDRIPDIAKEVFDDFVKDTVREYPELKAIRKAENLMVIGLPVTRILQVVEKLQPIMVVMGSQGRTGLKHLFLGSKAEQLVQLCPVPVTIVKQKK